MSGNGQGYDGGGYGEQPWMTRTAGGGQYGSGYGEQPWAPRRPFGGGGNLGGYGGNAQPPGMGGYGQNAGNPGYSLTGGQQHGMVTGTTPYGGSDTGNGPAPAPWRGDEGYNPGDYGYQPPQQQPGRGVGGITPPMPGGFGVPTPDGLQPFAPGTGGLRGGSKMFPNFGPFQSQPAPQGPVDGYGQGLTLEQMRGLGGYTGYGGR